MPPPSTVPSPRASLLFAEATSAGAPPSELIPELLPELPSVPDAAPVDEPDPAPEPLPEEEPEALPEEEEVLSVSPFDSPTPPFEPEQAGSAAIAAVRTAITKDFLSTTPPISGRLAYPSRWRGHPHLVSHVVAPTSRIWHSRSLRSE